MEPLRYQHGIARADASRFGFKIIKFCQGITADKPFYAFIAIEPQNLGYFENRYRPGEFSDFSPFGAELLRGWGHSPPDAIIDFVSKKHNIEFGVNTAYILHLTGIALQTQDIPNGLCPYKAQAECMDMMKYNAELQEHAGYP